MNWSVGKEGGELFISVMGKRVISMDGSKNVIQSAKLGFSRDELWIKLKGDRVGKVFKRQFFDRSTEDGTLSRKFRSANSNSAFLQILEEEGVSVLHRKRKETGELASTIPNHPSAMPQPQKISPNEDIMNLKKKCIERLTVDINKLDMPPKELVFRQTDHKWKNTLKEKLQNAPECLGTLPVLHNDNGRYTLLGGCHLVAALKELMVEDADEMCKAFRNIPVEVFSNVSKQEALLIAAYYQNRQGSKNTSFQDRVRICRRCFEEKEGDRKWKKDALKTLQVLDGKKYTEGSVSTILTTAGFSPINWNLTSTLFEEYTLTRPDASFPQTLFRHLQGLPEQTRQNLKALASSCLENWEELDEEVTSRILTYTGSIETPDGRKRFLNFVDKEIQENKTGLDINIKILKNGKDISNEYEQLIKKYIHKIRISAEKNIEE